MEASYICIEYRLEWSIIRTLQIHKVKTVLIN